MLANKLADLECANGRLRRGRVGSIDHITDILSINLTLINRTYVDALYTELSTISEIHDTQ